MDSSKILPHPQESKLNPCPQESMLKIIFLDIDGVLAIPNSMNRLDDGCQNNLGLILENTKAKIVISSSWRKHTLGDTVKYMDDNGFLFSDKIIGITIRAYHHIHKGFHLGIPRGVEIKQWVDTNIHSNNGKDFLRKELGMDWNYVIIDDDSDMLLEHINHFIQTDPLIGLTNNQALLAIDILNKKTFPICYQ